jgi:hypothetical protein
MAIPSVSVNCISIKETYERGKSKKDDFGYSQSKAEPEKTWVVKFEIAAGQRAVKIALAYETEAEARKFGEGQSYSILTWLSLAFG